MLDDLKTAKKTVGVKQSLKALENGTVKLTFIAKDADPKVTNTIKEISEKNSIEIIYVDNMKLLGKSCGIDVGSAVACVLKGS